jgi:hypothetical protein
LAALAVTPKLHAEQPNAAQAEPPTKALAVGLEIEDSKPPELATGGASPLVVRVHLKGCSEFSEEEVERVLSAELAVDSPHSENVHEPTWVVVQCVGNKVVLEVHDPISRKIVQRRFDFTSPKTQARGRLVALAAAELVLASWAELAVLPPPQVEPEGSAPTPQQKDRVRRRVKVSTAPSSEAQSTLLLGTDPGLARETVGPAGERIVYDDYVWERLPGRFATRLLALASLRKFPGHAGALVGGGVRLGSDSLPLHGWALDALVETGTVGSVRVDNFTLGGMLFFVRELRQGIVARAGAGLRAGLVQSAAENGAAHANSPVFWGWPMLALSSSARLGKLVIEIATEGGYASLPAGPGSPDPLRGVWLNAQLGLGISLTH